MRRIVSAAFFILRLGKHPDDAALRNIVLDADIVAGVGLLLLEQFSPACHASAAGLPRA